MRNFKLTRNPFLLFSPFLLLFLVLVITQQSDVLQGDESGYISFANNLLHGFYSPPAPDINLWWGPGYPILLMPFVGSGLPLLCIPLMNAVFQYLSIVLLFKAMLDIVDYRKTIFFTLSWALCYSSYQYLYLIYTETFTIFLISLLIFSIVKAFNTHSTKYLIIAGLNIGYIALTKIMFGYVILLLLAGAAVLWILHRNSQNYRRSLIIMLIAFVTTIPYLLYTYNLTGRLLYWGNSGGMSLYWMSTTYENEYGSWNNETFTANHIDSDNAGSTFHLKLNHQKEIDEIKKFKGVQKDDEYKRIAIHNILNNPAKYLKNIISNISNMLFGFPTTYTYQRPIIKIWYFSILYSLILFALFPTLINWRKLAFSIRFLFIFSFVYLGGSSLVSVSNRQFIIIVPVLLIWIAYILDQSVTFKINFSKK